MPGSKLHVHRLLGLPWPLSVRQRRGVRRPSLRLSPGGRITVTLPAGVDPVKATAYLLRAAEPWLERRLRPLARARRLAPLPQQVHFPAVDERWSVRHRPEGRGYRHDREMRTVWVGGTEEAARAALRRWLRRHAQASFEPRLEALARDCGLAYGRLVVRHQRSRWGSCSARGEISLNCVALFLPPPALRYLMVHELCHTHVPDHSRAFWTLLARFVPDFAVWDRHLRQAMAAVPEWARPL